MDRQKSYLLIAICIPIIMILIVAISLLFPVKKLSPPYQLLYVIGDNSEPYTCLQNMAQKFYQQKSGRQDFYKIEPEKCKKLRLFVYDFMSDQATPITFDEAKKFAVAQNLPTTRSENFYISRYCYNGPDFGIWSMRSTYNDVCLVKGDYKRLLNVHPNEDQSRIFYFYDIGWILPKGAQNLEKK